MMTGAQYIESLREMKTQVYMFGEKVDNWVDHPIIRPSINCVAMTYELASRDEYKDIMQLGDKYGVDTPTVDAMAYLASTMLKRDLIKNSKYTLEYIDIDHMTDAQLQKYLREGEYTAK